VNDKRVIVLRLTGRSLGQDDEAQLDVPVNPDLPPVQNRFRGVKRKIRPILAFAMPVNEGAGAANTDHRRNHVARIAVEGRAE